MTDTKAIIRWSAYEHEHIERTADWYWALAIVTVSGIIISVLLHDILFAIIIALAAFTIILMARTPPQLVDFEISERGIRTGHTLHRYHHILAFWVEDEVGDRPLLLVDTTKWSSPNLVIPIEHVEPAAVRAYLLEHATERYMAEPRAHKILAFFGF